MLIDEKKTTTCTLFVINDNWYCSYLWSEKDMNNRCQSAVFLISFLCLGDDMLEIFFKTLKGQIHDGEVCQHI